MWAWKAPKSEEAGGDSAYPGAGRGFSSHRLKPNASARNSPVVEQSWKGNLCEMPVPSPMGELSVAQQTSLSLLAAK